MPDTGTEIKGRDIVGILREWAPVGAMIFSLIVFADKMNAVPAELEKLQAEVKRQEQVDVQQNTVNAVQDEQVRNIVSLLTEIRDDLRRERR